MKMSYYQPRGHTGHFIGQTENPFKIIRIVKHLNFLDSRFSMQQLFRKSRLSDKRVPEKRNQSIFQNVSPTGVFSTRAPTPLLSRLLRRRACSVASSADSLSHRQSLRLLLKKIEAFSLLPSRVTPAPMKHLGPYLCFGN
jgi:hypothetical protein